MLSDCCCRAPDAAPVVAAAAAAAVTCSVPDPLRRGSKPIMRCTELSTSRASCNTKPQTTSVQLCGWPPSCKQIWLAAFLQATTTLWAMNLLVVHAASPAADTLPGSQLAHYAVPTQVAPFATHHPQDLTHGRQGHEANWHIDIDGHLLHTYVHWAWSIAAAAALTWKMLLCAPAKPSLPKTPALWLSRAAVATRP